MKRWFSETAKVVSIRSVLRSVSMIVFFAVVLPVYVGMTSDQFWPAWPETFVAVLVMGAGGLLLGIEIKKYGATRQK